MDFLNWKFLIRIILIRIRDPISSQLGNTLFVVTLSKKKRASFAKNGKEERESVY